MALIKVHRAIAHLEGFSDKELGLIKPLLTYHDKSAEFAYQKFRKQTWFASKFGDQAFQDRCNEMKADIKKSLLFEKDGAYSTYSGLVQEVVDAVKVSSTQVTVQMLNASEDPPEFTPIPWKSQPPQLRPYQSEAVETLQDTHLAAIEYATGSGKSLIIAALARNVGRKTIVMVPSKSIGGQMYDTLRRLLGDSKVGYYGDGKKDYKKLITVGIAASLTRLEPGDPAYEELAKAEVFLTDEAHFIAADTFAKVALGVAGNAYYRWSVSGTVTRGDGSELLLKGLTGPVVRRLSVKEGVDQGFLAKPVFKMFKVPSSSSYFSADANDMTRVHLYQNNAICKAAGELATAVSTQLGHSVVILVDEVDQFTRLLPHLPSDVAFAHGGLTKDNKGKVPQAYHKSDPKELVRRFNDREFKVLVGTSCIATGTDILPVQTIIYLVGGKSVIGASQAVGRGTRLFGDKKHCGFIDFMPIVYSPGNGIDDNSDNMRFWSCVKRHAVARLAIYDSIYGPPTLT